MDDRKRFSQSDKDCEMRFLNSGPWWHLYTPGKETPIILTRNEDYVFGMNLMARCACETKDVIIVAFELMDNHIHIVLMGNEKDAVSFFVLFRRRLSRYLREESKTANGMEVLLPDQFRICLKPVTDLKALRTLIVYIHRNGYVVDTGATPFSYKWGTGRYYFNDFPIEHSISELSMKERRLLLRSGDVSLPEDYKVLEGYVSPASYCSLKSGMAMFRNAHQYFNMISRKVESYSELAEELDDGEFLPDQELFWEIWRIMNESYGITSSRDLTKAQRLDIARILHFKYRSSNGQIRRVLNLPQAELDILFPIPKSNQ